MIGLLINIIDYSNKRKILKFFKTKLQERYLNVIDIGAHKGETIEFFYKNFNINKLIAFEPNESLFTVLNKKFNKKNLLIYNYGVGEKNESKFLNILIDSASSTINEINTNTEYYKRKKKYYLLGKNKSLLKEKKKIKVINLSNFILKNENKIDVLKIDTEGFEFNILKGITEKDFKKINYIYFEHHYDLMIKKHYKFQEINQLLINNNFFQKYKIKMKFRKSFEYIYEQKY